MPIKQTTPQSAVDGYIKMQMEWLEVALISILRYIGEAALSVARSNNTYQDQTGNLRSSIGYVIAQNGRIVYESGFDTVRHGSDGAKLGNAFVGKLVQNHPRDICLIMVAGMEYAVHVQNRGYDVLYNAELLAERLVPRMLKQLGLK